MGAVIIREYSLSYRKGPLCDPSQSQSHKNPTRDTQASLKHRLLIVNEGPLLGSGWQRHRLPATRTSHLGAPPLHELPCTRHHPGHQEKGYGGSRLASKVKAEPRLAKRDRERVTSSESWAEGPWGVP